MLAQAAGAGPADHDDSEEYLRAAIPAPSATAEHGWIGGNPSLPDPFRWPERGGQPYQFLCQVDCASLPPKLWGGLGPRTGWLAVFAGFTGSLDVKVVHAPGLGAERHNGAAWRKSASALHSMDGRLDRFLSAPPKWRLHVVHPGDGEDCVPDRLRQRPTASGPFRVAAPEHRPFDWTTLELLLSEAMAHGEERAKAFAHSARERTARLKPPPERLTTALRDILVTSDQLTKALQAFRAGQPFSPEGWLSHADLIVRIMLLEDEYFLQSGHSFESVVQRMQIELVNNQGFLRSMTAPSPLFQPETTQGRAHTELVGLVADLERDLRADGRIPPRPAKAIGPNVADWKEYRENFPEDWQRYAGRVRHIRELFYAFWRANAIAAEAATRGKPKTVSIPGTLDEAFVRQERQRSWTRNRLDTIACGDPDADNEMRMARQRQVDAGQFALRMDDELRKVRGRDPAAAFSPDDWVAICGMIDESADRDILSQYWRFGYSVVRSEMAKQIYSVRPDSLPSAARLALEAEWRFDAEQATLQLGGTPRGWCENFIEQKPDSVLLLQIPSNNLTHFLFGDVSDLAISISRADLKRHHFGSVRVDVSN